MSRPADEQAAKLLRETDAVADWDAPRVERALGTLHRNIRRQRVLRATAATLTLASAAALLFFVAPRIRGRATPATTATSTNRLPSPATNRSLPLQLNDGSVITPAARAHVVVQEVSAARVRVDLEDGVAGFEVARRPEREFVVEAGAIRVVVIGTRFEVERLGLRTRVRVERGHVRVFWNAAGLQQRDLLAGGEGTYPDETTTAATATSAAPSTTTETQDSIPEATVQEPTPTRNSRPHNSGRDWRRLAQQGVYREAYDLIVEGGTDSVHDDVDDLLLAADAARLSGRPAQALPYLDRVVDRHANDGRASMAAFTRGRILLGLGRSRTAAASFDRSLSLGAQGSLHENALARSIEAHGRAGDSSAAAALARRYLQQYPHGRWLSLVHAYGGIDE